MSSLESKDKQLQEASRRFTEATGEVVGSGETLLTQGHRQWRSKRPALVMSCTSWTPDEDFGVLLRALEGLDERWAGEGRGNDKDRPFVLVVVTGKGPLKEHYEVQMRALELRRVAVCTMWLEAEDYPRLLGCADLGVSLHTSSSGVCVVR
jgi:beta-1,4-mannosyltransferase